MGTWMFWIIAGALTLVAAAVLARAALRGADDGTVPAAYDLQVYRDQLREIERDMARGIVAPDEAERLKSEIARRILAADASLQAQRSGAAGAVAASGPVRAMALVAGLAVVGGTLVLYAVMGTPGYGDLGLQARLAAAEEARLNRPAQADAEAQVPPFAGPTPDANYAELMDQLRQTVAERPNDLTGHQLLTRNEAQLGNFAAAYAAQERVLAIKGEAATGQDWLDYADLLILAAGGYVSPEAERALTEALARDPGNGAARYYAGLLMAQTGRPDRAFTLWDALLRDGPADAPWIGPIRQQIEDMALRAGQFRYVLPPETLPETMPAAPSAPAVTSPQVAPGPGADDIAAAAEMTPEARDQMIRGMVEGLAARLADDGGSAQDWARLVGALAVLGETDRARAILIESRTRFAGYPEAVDEIEAAARAAGLTE